MVLLLIIRSFGTVRFLKYEIVLVKQKKTNRSLLTTPSSECLSVTVRRPMIRYPPMLLHNWNWLADDGCPTIRDDLNARWLM